MIMISPDATERGHVFTLIKSQRGMWFASFFSQHIFGLLNSESYDGWEIAFAVFCLLKVA
uniref:Uncharacterized protein n=1 Tax=Anguilla anguilla TaxID=7936 RepID=A0A0E9P7L6_ANGAN